MTKDNIPNKEECDCECHNSNVIFKHPLLCCIPCLYCGKNIKIEFYEEHEENCAKIFFSEEKNIPPTEELN